MKKLIFCRLFYFALIASCILIAGSCGKDNDNGPQPQLSDNIRAFVPQYVLDSFKQHGFTIHEGLKPPNLEDIFKLSPHLCTYDNSRFEDSGDIFVDYKYRFYDQDAQKLTIKLDYKTVPNAIDTATGAGAFISGSGNSFTIFEQIKGTEGGVSYESIAILSGVMTSQGIQHFQYGFFNKSKGPDPASSHVDPGTTRIFKDLDGLADRLSIY